jgi:hypothetical protein
MQHTMQRPTCNIQCNDTWQGLRYDFDRNKKEAECLRQISQAELCTFYDTHVVTKAPRRRSFTVHVIPAQKFAQESSLSVATVSNLHEFRRGAGWFDDACGARWFEHCSTAA